MHVGHVNINGEKMSKSLNNFILVKDIVNKDNANGLRWFFYKTKYQHPLNFTVNSLNEAISEVNRLTDALAAAKTILLANKKFKNIQVPFDPEFIKAIEYGCIGFLKKSSAVDSSTICPAYITAILSA